jgi:hypothetical protein
MEGRVIDAFDEETCRWYTARVLVEPQPADAAGKRVTLHYIACGLEDGQSRNAVDIIWRRCWKERGTSKREPYGPAERVYLNVLVRELLQGRLGDDFVDQGDFKCAVQGLVGRGCCLFDGNRTVWMDAETKAVREASVRTNRNWNTYKPVAATVTQVVADARALVEKARAAFLVEVRERTPGVTEQLRAVSGGGRSRGYTAHLKSKSVNFTGGAGEEGKQWTSQGHSTRLGAQAARDRQLMKLGFVDCDLFFWTAAELEHAEKSDTKGSKEAAAEFEMARDELFTLLAKPLLAGAADKEGRAAAQARFDAAATNYARFAKGAAAEFEMARDELFTLLAKPLLAGGAERATAEKGRAAAQARFDEKATNYARYAKGAAAALAGYTAQLALLERVGATRAELASAEARLAAAVRQRQEGRQKRMLAGAPARARAASAYRKRANFAHSLFMKAADPEWEQRPGYAEQLKKFSAWHASLKD